MTNKAIDKIVGKNRYENEKVADWNTKIIDKCIEDLVDTGKRFKYVGNSYLKSDLYSYGKEWMWIDHHFILLLESKDRCLHRRSVRNRYDAYSG